MLRIFPIFFVIHIFLFNLNLFAQTSSRQITREEYVATYKDMAIREMYEFGIPASIKLAQALLETGNGNSKLAREGNNHFGIKCHGWQGKSMKVDDDAPQECFRKYDNADQSYKDHSAFLSTRPRYASLFELETTDYKGWAHGLKRAGYATNPRYAEMVIKIIEDLDLTKYDVPKSVILSGKKPQKEIGKTKPVKSKATTRQILTNNGRKYIIARKGDNFYDIAKEFNIYSYQVWKYNELSRRDAIREGEMVYLEKKKSQASVPFHTVAKGEDLRTISQIYGIRLSTLRKLNHMKKDDELRVGQILWLQERKPKE